MLDDRCSAVPRKMRCTKKLMLQAACGQRVLQCLQRRSCHVGPWVLFRVWSVREWDGMLTAVLGQHL